MTEEQFHRGSRMIRYVGILVTVLFFVAGLAFGAIIPNGGGLFGSLFPYVLLVTVIVAVVFVIAYFGYNAIQGGRVKKL